MSNSPKYYIYLFKKDGHTTWRMSMVQEDVKRAKATEVKRVEIDRLTGEIVVL